MQYQIGRSRQRDPQAAVQEATAGLQNPRLVLFFSGVTDFPAYAQQLRERFPQVPTMGSTTFAAFCKEGALKETLLVIGFIDGIRCEASLLERVDRYPLKYVERVQKCAASFQKPQNTICLEFSSALKRSEELVLSTLNAVLEKREIPVFGGSSGDKGNAERVMVALNGAVYEDACVFVMLENLSGKIRLYRENIYKPTKHVFKSTRVDVRRRIVYEYNGRPAAKMVAEALGVPISKLPEYLDSYPMGRIVGDEMYIVANCAVVEGDAMEYHARIYNNSTVVLLEPDDYRTVIRGTLQKIRKENASPKFSFVVNCLARSMLFESGGYLDEFARTVGSALGAYVGFAGYGEQLRNQHFNQTMVVAVFE